MAKNTAKTHKKVKKKIFRYITYFLFIMSILTMGLLFFLNVIPLGYLGILGVLLLLFDGVITYFLLGKGWKKRLFGTILSIIVLVLLLFIINYSLHTLSFFNKIGGKDYNTENYSVIVLQGSDYNKIKDLKDCDIGYIKLDDDKGTKKALDVLNHKVKSNLKTYDDTSKMLEDFLDEEVEAILIEDAEKSIFEEEHEEFLKQEKVIYQFSVDVEMDDKLAKEVDISSTPFNVYISGIDTYGKITSVSRSDVNMVVTVNPITHQALFTSIPRDYYVKLHGIDTTYKDKLTHAGIHGIDMSVQTVEDLLDIEINYYAKVNFTSLVSIVDELGGIEVETDEAFRAYYIEDEVVDYSFKKGVNKLNGKQALAYSRERYSLASGDVARTKHQQQVLEAIINKALSKKIITKYGDLLDALDGKFVTNIGTKNITNLVKNQMKSMPSWTIEKNTLSGEGELNYTYSYKKAKSYVMIPDEESLNDAKAKINNLLEVKTAKSK